jgi:enediyne biosynthesis protein CalE5
MREPAVTAAKIVMLNGKVVTTGISPKMREIARTRATPLGLNGIMEFRESDGEKIDMPEQTAKFDVILSRWGLMFFPNLPAALGSIRQLLSANGRLSAAVWSAPRKVPLVGLAFASIKKQINAPAPPPTTPGPFALTDREVLKESFNQAGFKDIETDTFQVTFEFHSPENYTRFHQQNTAPIHAMSASHTEEVKKGAWISITEAVWQYADSHGRVNLENEVICIVGRN